MFTHVRQLQQPTSVSTLNALLLTLEHNSLVEAALTVCLACSPLPILNLSNGVEDTSDFHTVWKMTNSLHRPWNKVSAVIPFQAFLESISSCHPYSSTPSHIMPSLALTALCLQSPGLHRVAVMRGWIVLNVREKTLDNPWSTHLEPRG